MQGKDAKSCRDSEVWVRESERWVELSPVPAALRSLQAPGPSQHVGYQHQTHCSLGRKILLGNYFYSLSSQTPSVFGWLLPESLCSGN